MDAFPTRIVLIAMAALLGASANGRDAQAQIREANGIVFLQSGSWSISASQSGGNFIPEISYSGWFSNIDCCLVLNTCYFTREDTGQFVTANGDVPTIRTISGAKALTGFTANSDGTPKRYAISLSANCELFGRTDQPWHLPGMSDIRLNRFTLVVNP